MATETGETLSAALSWAALFCGTSTNPATLPTPFEVTYLQVPSTAVYG